MLVKCCYMDTGATFGDIDMIRFLLKELIADREFKTGKRVTLEQIARETGVHRMTLSRISGQRGYNTTTDNIGKLCRFFGCTVDKVIAYVPDEDVENQEEVPDGIDS